MVDVFISYSSEDKTQALELFNRLVSDGHSCWIDESGINAAAQWSSEIVRAIESCTVFVILLSRAAIESSNVIKELSLASEGKKSIIPVDLEPIELSPQVKYQLAGLQHVAHTDYSKIRKAVQLFKEQSSEGETSGKSSTSNESKWDIAFDGNEIINRLAELRLHERLWTRIAILVSLLALSATIYFFFIDNHRSGNDLPISGKESIQLSDISLGNRGYDKPSFSTREIEWIKERMTSNPASNSNAYLDYLTAVILYDRGRRKDFQLSLQFVQSALKRDSAFAPAHELILRLYKKIYDAEEENEYRATHGMPSLSRDN